MTAAKPVSAQASPFDDVGQVLFMSQEACTDASGCPGSPGLRFASLCKVIIRDVEGHVYTQKNPGGGT